MPFNIAQAIEEGTAWFLKAPAVRRVAKSSIATATVITILIMLVVAFVYRDVETEEGRHILALRSGFWCFIVVLGLMHFHQKIIESASGPVVQSSQIFAPVVLKPIVD